MKQHTIKDSFSFESKGLHTGLYIHATFSPAEENTGIRICRTDLDG
jgi:UDP-3-O-acyl-N-acetylglucosamine deacetylase